MEIHASMPPCVVLRREARVFGAVFAAAGTEPALLQQLARDFSPRLEICGDREIVLDLSGLERLFGEPRLMAAELRGTAADRGLRIRVAIAGTRTAARLLVHHRAGITIVAPGTEAATLAPLPLALLSVLAPRNTEPEREPAHEPGTGNLDLGTLRRWGLRTLGEFAALPAAEVTARLGQNGARWQRLARGEDPAPLVPVVPDERFEQALDLEWPIDGLEPLSFVLGRLMEPLSAHLEQRDRAAAVLHVQLHLVKAAGEVRPIHARSLELPSPIRDARTLRTLALLDLESHPPAAAIERVVVAVDPTPGRILQYSLLTRPLPTPEQLSTLMARLNAVMGEGRCGSPQEVDSWKPGAFAMKPFTPVADHGPQRHRDAEEIFETLCASESLRPGPLAVVLRRFRFPLAARVRVDEGKPTRLAADRRAVGGERVVQCAGPWRTSGEWWQEPDGGPVRRSLGGGGWDRDEWDVTLDDGATYRLFRECDTNRWFVDGIVD